MIKNRNYSLDLLRVIACYLVIQQHASEFYYIGEGGTVVTGDNTFWIGITDHLYLYSSCCRDSCYSLCKTKFPHFFANVSPESYIHSSHGVYYMPDTTC